MDIKNIYRTYYKQVKNNKNKWQSIKHVTIIVSTYIHCYTGLFYIDNTIPPFSHR